MAAYDSADLLTAVGALQLLPENSDRFVRLEAFAHIASSQPSNESKPKISHGRLKSVANTGFLASNEVASYEDPQEYAFTETFGFDGGPFIVFPGPADETTLILQNLLKAIFKHPEQPSDRAWLQSAHRLVTAALVLSDEIARRAGHGRSVDPVYRPEAPVIIPTKQRLDQLKRAITFSQADLESILSPRGIDLHDLYPFITLQGKVDLSNYRLGNGDLYASPIVQNEDRYIVALPHRLLNALRHTLVCQATEKGLSKEVRGRFSEAVWADVIESLEYFETKQVSPPTINSSSEYCLIDATFSFDTDKALHVIQVTDPLSSYSVNDVFGEWQTGNLSTVIQQQINSIGSDLFAGPHSPNEIMVLVIIQGIGRSYVVPLKRTDWAYFLHLSAADLHTIAHLEAGDSLLLWKYARAAEKIRRTTVIGKSDELSEFYLYRKNGYSYYLSDEERYTHISVLPGYVADIRQEELRSRDRHYVRSYRSRMFGNLTEVALLFSSREIPIYFTPNSLNPSAVELLVKGLPLPVWIINADYETDEQRTHLRRYKQIAETVAYWIWQFTPSLREAFTTLASKYPEILIQIELFKPDEWERTYDFDNEDSSIKVNLTNHYTEIKLTISPSAVLLFNRADNSGEREMMSHLFKAFRDLLPTNSRAQLTDSVIASVLDAHAPLGKKKKLVFFEMDFLNGLVLSRDGLPDYRKVQDADQSDLLDELGEYLTQVEGMEVGSIPDNDRTRVLNRAVGFFYRELIKLVATLRPEGLLEWLTAYQEAVTYTSAFHQLMIPTRQACFSSESEMVREWQAESSEYNAAQAASRFVIEFVTANPPKGIRPISLSVYDRLQALALHIINFGGESDLIHFGLADNKMSILKSGRLGRDREVFFAAQSSWLPILTQGNISRINRYFDSLWRDRSNDDPGRAEYVSRLDVAAIAEFGFSLAEQLDFAIVAAQIGKSLNPVVACLPRAEFVRRFVEKLNWNGDKVARALVLLSLTPRNDFLNPDPPFRPEDVYPWRFNRTLSYLRRPFLTRYRERSDPESAEVVWGIRNMRSFWRNLTSLCDEGRLKARSSEMRSLLGELSNLRGERFNDKVADFLQSLPRLIVKRRVRKIGSLRIAGARGDLGDIDVLVADLKDARLELIECKDLAQARTPYEMAGEIENLFHGREGRRSIIELHQQRVDWVRNHLQSVLEWLGILDKRKWKIEPMVVVDQELFTPYLQTSSMPIMSIEQLMRK